MSPGSGGPPPALRRFFARQIRRAPRLPPERVDEDADRAAGCADVLDFSARDPVVDRATADTDQLARLHDRNGLVFNHHSCMWRCQGFQPAFVMMYRC